MTISYFDTKKQKDYKIIEFTATSEPYYTTYKIYNMNNRYEIVMQSFIFDCYFEQCKKNNSILELFHVIEKSIHYFLMDSYDLWDKKVNKSLQYFIQHILDIKVNLYHCLQENNLYRISYQ